MRSYTFKVIIEEDQFADGRSAYLAYCPVLKGATTWGKSWQEALKNLQEVITLVLEDMQVHSESIPTEPPDAVIVSEEPRITVTV